MQRMPVFFMIAALIGCSKSPTSSGNPGGTDTTSSTPPSDAECAARNNNTEPKLVECIQSQALWQHMIDLQGIADANPGPDGHPSRSAGEPGYLASVNYVAGLMRAAGYRVTIQNYTLAYTGFASPPLFSEVSPTATTYAVGTDFDAAFAGSGEVTAQVQPVGGILDSPAGHADVGQRLRVDRLQRLRRRPRRPHSAGHLFVRSEGVAGCDGRRIRGNHLRRRESGTDRAPAGAAASIQRASR